MPKYEGICPAHYELDLYTGCPFGCLYCVERKSHANASAPKGGAEEFIRLMQTENLQNNPVYLSPKTDAYQPLEERAELARAVLEELHREERPVFVITKSPLVARDKEFFAGRSNAFIALSVNTLDPAVTDRLEPGAPGIGARLEAAEKLASDSRIRLVVKIDPILPGLTDGGRLGALLDRLKRLKPYAVTAETLRLSRPIFDRMRDALRDGESEQLLAAYPVLEENPIHARLDYRLGLFSRIAAELGAAGIRASFCRASLPRPVTPYDCRGGYP